MDLRARVCRVVLHNANWANSFEKAKEDFEYVAPVADVVMAVELNRVWLRRIFKKHNWRVSQTRKIISQKNVGIIYRRKFFDHARSRWTIGSTPMGYKIMSRWILVSRVKYKGKKKYFIVLHLPPKRFAKYLDPMFFKALKVVLKGLNKRHQDWIAAADWNLKVHGDVLTKFARSVDARMKGSGILGFMVSNRVFTGDFKIMDKQNSDHNPVSLEVYF